MVNGQLPWRKIKDKDSVGLMKSTYDHRMMLKHLPQDFRQFLEHIESLTYTDTPNYQLLNLIFERSIKRRNIKPEDPYDWEMISENRNSNNENNESSMGYYSDNNNKIKNVYCKNIDLNNRSNNAANAVSSNMLASNNFANFHNNGNNNANEVTSKSMVNKMSNLNLNITNKDVSLVTQMNACAEDLSLKPNATDMDNKRNVTQYCVSNMWEKSVANDENECCNDDNDECDPVNPVDKSTENALNQSRASRERLSANLCDSQDIYRASLNVAKFSSTQRRDLNEKELEEAQQFYCSQNGYFNENNDLQCADMPQMCNMDNANQCNFHISLIKPSNTYPIIKDLNKLRSMSLPSMAVASNSDDKNESYNLNGMNKFDKKFDDDGDNNPGGGYSNNENNYSYNNLCNHECNQSSSHRYVRNSYLNERGINNSSNTNDICTEREYAIRESVSIPSSKNSPMSKLSAKVQQSDTCSQLNANIDPKVISQLPSDPHDQKDEDEEEEDEEEEDEEEEEEEEEEVEEEEVDEEEVEEEEEEDEEIEEEVDEEEEEEETESSQPPNNIDQVEINGNQLNGSIVKCDSSANKSLGSKSSKSSVSYAPNGNIRSRATIVVKPAPCNNNSDRASLSKSSSGSYYYTTTTVSCTPSNGHIRPILKTSSAPKVSGPNSSVNGNASSTTSISNRRRTSASYSSRTSLSNSHVLNNIPVLSFPKVDDSSTSQDQAEKENHKCIYSPMSQSSSDSGSSSSCSSGSKSRSKGNRQVHLNSSQFFAETGQPTSSTGAGQSGITEPGVVVPITPPSTPPPLVEIVSNRRRRFFVK